VGKNLEILGNIGLLIEGWVAFKDEVKRKSYIQFGKLLTSVFTFQDLWL
jgi:hypothetical protein